MDRRSFFKTMIGGAVATAAVRTWPFRVYSLPSPELVTVPQTIRFIKAYDVAQDKFISRFDVLYGWMSLQDRPSLKLELPRAVENAEILYAKPGDFLSRRELKRFADNCIDRYGYQYSSEQLLDAVENRAGKWLTDSTQIGVEVA